ncbi:MAG: hypothetical protein NT090_02740, partial [Acidobacteria bacterium]|nr:hypothetical protein [Acidobacteriota bacterium]
MNVVGHQAVAEQRQLVEAGVLPQQAEINEAVALGLENLAAGVTPLRDVIGHAHGGDPSQSSHIDNVAGMARTSQGTSRLSPRFRMRGTSRLSPRSPFLFADADRVGVVGAGEVDAAF